MTLHAPDQSAGARGYVMAIVLVLVITSGLLIGVALRRQGAQTLTINRQIDAYREHHAAQGLQELVAAWARQYSAANVKEALGEEGLAFTIDLADGSELSVYLEDAQGLALADLSGLEGNELRLAGRLLLELGAITGEADFERYTRAAGPAAISVSGAPEAVLTAAVRAAVPDVAQQDALLSRLIGLRDLGREVRATDLGTALSGAGVSGDARSDMLELLQADAEAWRVLIEQTRDRRVTARYEGVTELRTSAGGGGGATPGSSSAGMFLSWRELDPDGPRPTLLSELDG
ncbi:MAG: hypothetical protein AAF356_08935 [Planctomycetota bacterium]